MSDTSTMHHGRRAAKSSIDLQWLKRNRTTVGLSALGMAAFIGSIVALSTMNAGPYTLAQGDDLASITGTKAALDMGEDWNRPVQALSDGKYYDIDYKIARLLAGDTKKVGLIVNVPPGAEVKKTNWHWDYKPPLADR